jgi:hypothetical protein
MTCRTCKWFDLKPRKDGKIVPRKGDHCRCTVLLPPPPVMPKSITIFTDTKAHYGFGNILWPERGGYMSVDDGEGCAFHEPRAK